MLLIVLSLSCSTRGASPTEPVPQRGIIFDQLLARHRAAAERDRKPGQCHSDHPTLTMSEFRYSLIEARLWATAFPTDAEQAAFPLAGDTASNTDDRALAIAIIGTLAGIGNPRAEPVLLAASRSPEKGVAQAALFQLSQRDATGRHLALYQEKARALDIPALIALGDWADERSKEILEEVMARGGGEYEIAAHSWRRISWLKSPDRDKILAAILRSRSAMDFNEFHWALRMARRHSLPGLTGLIETRLREDEAEHLKFFASIFDVTDGCRLEEAYRRDFVRGGVADPPAWYFDELLKAYADSGGALTELEKERLDYIGYGPHPRTRLFELVFRWK
jgi:hypothetical protein